MLGAKFTMSFPIPYPGPEDVPAMKGTIEVHIGNGVLTRKVESDIAGAPPRMEGMIKATVTGKLNDDVVKKIEVLEAETPIVINLVRKELELLASYHYDENGLQGASQALKNIGFTQIEDAAN